MEGAFAGEHASAASVGAGKLNRCFNAFAAGTGKENFAEIAARKPAESPREFARDFCDVALQHDRSGTI